MRGFPEISVVIPTLDRQEVLKSCLQSLSEQTFQDFQVIVVSAKAEELEEVISGFLSLKITLIEHNQPGLAGTRNAGLKAAKSRIVSFIDDDVILNPSWAQELVNTFNKSEDIGGVSGPTIIPSELIENRDILSFVSRSKGSWLFSLLVKPYIFFVLENRALAVGKIFKSGAFSFGANFSESAQIKESLEVDYLEACNMSFRKDILDKIGGFAEEYRGVGDWSEPDLAFRVRKEGFKLIFNPLVSLRHIVSCKGIFSERAKDSYQRMSNFIRFYRSWLKPDTPAKSLGLAVNLIYLNGYWCYKFLQTGQLSWLAGISTGMRAWFSCSREK